MLSINTKHKAMVQTIPMVFVYIKTYDYREQCYDFVYNKSKTQI